MVSNSRIIYLPEILPRHTHYPYTSDESTTSINVNSESVVETFSNVEIITELTNCLAFACIITVNQRIFKRPSLSRPTKFCIIQHRKWYTNIVTSSIRLFTNSRHPFRSK